MKLIIYKEGRAEELVLEENIVAGRGSACGLRMDDPGLSGTHAKFIVDGETVTLKDLDSTNGTFVNDERITERVLHDGDRITLGKASVLFSIAAATPAGEAVESRLVTPAGGYEEDEPTPVDKDFAPEEEKSAEGPRPELLSREGKWYLRENVTGKEVEIVPVRKQMQAPAVVMGGDVLHRHSFIAAAVILLLGVILALLLRSILTPSETSDTRWSFEHYAASLRRALVELDAAELARAEYFLSTAAEKYAHNDLAKLLLDVVSVWRDPERRENLREVERVLAAVGKYAGKHFEDVSRWAAEKLRKVAREHDMEATISEIQDLIAGGQMKKALEKLSEVDEDSRWYPKAQEMIKDVSMALSQGFLDLAQAAMRAGDWKKALEYFQKAVDTGATTAYIKTDMATCRRNQRDKQTLARARAHFDEKRLEAAASTLAMIGSTGRYHADAEVLRAKINRRRLVQAAERFYNRGDKRGALAALKNKENDPACAALKQRILEVTKVFDEAQKLLDAGRPEDAIELWEEVTRLEPNERNHYHSRAAKQLDKWRDHPENIAELYLDNATDAETRNDYASMRKWLGKGLEVDPGNEDCMSKLEELKKEAVRLMQEALIIRKKDRREALKMFTQVTQMLPPEDPYRKEAQREIKRLKKKENEED